MQPDRFTVKSQEAVAAAQALAAERRNSEVTPSHLLVALRLIQGFAGPGIPQGAEGQAAGRRERCRNRFEDKLTLRTADPDHADRGSSETRRGSKDGVVRPHDLKPWKNPRPKSEPVPLLVSCTGSTMRRLTSSPGLM